MSGNRRSAWGGAADDRSAFDRRIGPQCLAIAASILVILIAIGLVALL